MKTRKPPNRKNTTPPKPRGTRRDPPVNAWPKGTTGNPTGAPRKGLSVAETIRTLGAMTPAELRETLKRLGGSGRSGIEQSLAALPQGTPMRFLLHASAHVASICEPQPGILTYLRDSDEGKPTERTEISGPEGGPMRTIFEFRDTRHTETESEREGDR